mmetsp:Transcript_13035/g.16299  ORF Transcript_13035/g.16299 Transcript_13035/m.16299 type:complete len:109 (+) Transcript_13035:2071-2397(+)
MRDQTGSTTTNGKKGAIRRIKFFRADRSSPKIIIPFVLQTNAITMFTISINLIFNRNRLLLAAYYFLRPPPPHQPASHHSSVFAQVVSSYGAKPRKRKRDHQKDEKLD